MDNLLTSEVVKVSFQSARIDGNKPTLVGRWTV